MQNTDTQLIQDVDNKINKYKADIDDLKEKSKKLEISMSINDNDISNSKDDLIKLNPELSDIIDDPAKLQTYADSLRTQLQEWVSESDVETQDSSSGLVEEI